MKFVIYSRKSVFTGKGESIENQVEMCRQYVFANYPGSGETDLSIYEDEGYSGKNLDRPQFQRMLRDMERDRPDCLVCYRLDRISRSVGDFAALIEELDRRGVAFVCIREKFDTGTPMGKAMMYIASVFAQLERETIAERVRDNMLMLARTGRWLGGTTPTGYTSEQAGEVILDGKVKTASRLRPVPAELRTVETIYRKFLELQSLNGLRKYLYGQGVRSRAGRGFSLPGLREILQNPVYCTADREALGYFTERNADVCFTQAECGKRGLLAYNKRDYTKSRAPRNPVEKWIVAVGRHEGLIPGRDWVAVQALLSRGGPDEPRANARNGYALLSGLVFCAGCGRRMFSKARSGRAGQYDYICEAKLQLGREACGGQNLQGAAADGQVWRCLLPLLRPGRGAVRLLEDLRRELAAGEGGGAVGDSAARREAIGRELEHLAQALGQCGPDGAFAQKIAARAAGLEEELRRLEENARPDGAAGERGDQEALCAGLLDFPGEGSGLTAAERRTLVRLLVRRCEWDGTDLHVHLREDVSPAVGAHFPPS